MSGWLEFFEDEISCTECQSKFFTVFVEDGNCKDPPQVITSLAGGSTVCPVCNNTIRDSDITDTSLPTKI